MGNDIEIRVRVANQTGAGLTAVNASLNTLRQNADRASTALRTLTTRATAAATALGRLEQQAEGAARALHRLQSRADDTAASLGTLRTSVTGAGSSLRTFNTHANTTITRLDDMDSRALSTSVRVDGLADALRGAGDNMRDLRGGLGSLSLSAGNAANAIGGGSGGMGLKGQLIGAAAAMGTTLLPAIGAAAPMLVGLTGVGAGAALAMGDLKKKAKELKPAFEDLKKSAEKAIAPHTERAVKSLKGVMEDLQPSLVLGAETFGTITERAAKFADSPAFKSAFQKNMQLGVVFVEQFAESVGHFTQAFLDFGTKSGPSLEAFQNLFGGLLDTGLPDMFKGLERGIGGSADIINGLASMLNGDILPALGRFAGEWSKATGPLAGQALRLFGDIGAAAFDTLGAGMRLASPYLHDLAEGLRAVRTIGGAIAPTLKDVGLALASIVIPGSLDNAVGPLEALAAAVDRNKGAIQEGARFFGNAILDMAEGAITALPMITKGFQLMATGVLGAVDLLVSGMAKAFGDIPVIGEKFKNANKDFDKFKDSFLSGLNSAQRKTEEFAQGALPKLQQGRLKLNINNWESQIATAKGQLKSVPPEKRAALLATIADLQRKVASAKAQLGSVRNRSITVRANTDPFRSAVSGIAGRVLGTSYINVQMRRVESNAAPTFKAMGGPIRRLAGGGTPEGGRVMGPGTETSDSIPAMLSAGEYVVRASSVRKYGERFMDALNQGRLKVTGFAKGGLTKAEKEARAGARGDLTISHFGRIAGHQRSEFRSQLGNPDGIGSLVNSLNQWRGIIMKATHGGTERNLLKALDSAGKKLLTWEKQLGKASASLEKSKARLDELRQAASQLRETVKSGVLNSANITRGAQGDAPVTVASVMGGLTRSRDQASAFSKALADLKKKGLSGALIQQIGEAGIEGGGLETAGALLNASSSEIKSMNSLQSQITKSAAAAGQTTADAVYSAAIKTQEKLVKAWENTTKTLASKMDKLAGAMETLIEKGFAKKASGGIIGAATGGLRSGWTMVGEHEPELVRLPFGSRVYSGPDTRRMMAQPPWASMLNTPRSGGVRHGAAPAPSAPASNRPIVLNVSLAGREFGQIWVDVGRREVQARGGVKATLGNLTGSG